MTPDPISPVYYHTIELPDGLHEGAWDCRAATDVYLGHVDFAGKTVLEVGPANGYFTFEMERRGAQVTCLDLGQTGEWDIVPGPNIDELQVPRLMRENLARIERAFWEGHRATSSKARMVYGSIYQCPELVEPHQIGMLGNVLQHLRDPFTGLQRMAKMVTETIIVTETMWLDFPEVDKWAFLWLIPRAECPEVTHSWYQATAPWVGEVLKMLGFSRLRGYTHEQRFNPTGKLVPHFTMVGHR